MKQLLVTISILMLWGCAKIDETDADDTLKGDAHIYGRLSYTDLYNGKGDETILSNRKVFIRYANADTVNYLYYTKTDAQGNFSFTRLDRNTDYALFFNDTIGGARFSALTVIKTSHDSVRLVAANDASKQNALFFTVTSEQGDVVNGAEMRLYNNRETFEGDTTGQNYVEKISTDKYGRVLFYNLKPGKYYVRGKVGYSGVALTGDTTVNFDGTGFDAYTLRLKKVTAVNSFTIVTKDVNGVILPKVNFCVFSSQALQITEDCTLNLFSGNTNEAGEMRYTNITAREYFVLAKTTIAGKAYKGMASRIVTATGDSILEVLLKPVDDENRIDMIISDVTGTPVYGTDIYLFSSRVLFQADTILGYINKTKADPVGKASFSNLAPGRYFIKAQAIYGNLKLAGSDSATVTQNSMITLPIKVQ